MRNKTAIILLSVVVALLCLYHLSFTFIARGVQNDAKAFASRGGTYSKSLEQRYLDSVYKAPVFNLLGKEFTFQEVKQHELGLGLDLKGGMHVTMEVSPVEIVQALSGYSKDPAFLKAIEKAKADQRNSQDRFTTLFGRAYEQIAPNGRLSTLFANASNRGRISYDTPNSEVLAMIDKEVDEAIDRSFDILRTRIDKFGTTQPNIQRLKGTGRIQIELPGVDNPERVRKLLQGTAQLEFLEVWTPEEFSPYFSQLNDFLVKQEEAKKLNGGKKDDVLKDAAAAKDPLTASADSAADPLAAAAATDSSAKDSAALAANTAKKDTAKAASDSLSKKSSSQLAELFTQMPYGIGSNLRDTARVNRLFKDPAVRAVFPSNMRFLWDVKPVKGNDGAEFLQLYAVKKGRDGKAPLTGDYVTDARQDFGQTGKPEVTMQMNSNGAKRWKKLTGDNIGRPVAIVLDDYVYSAPNVQSEIAGGSSSISGSFTVEEAQDLAQVLKAGKLPAPTRIVEEAVVGPSLGQEAINQGLLSAIAGFVLVVLFMVMYYNRGGMVADLALLINVFFILGILSQFNAALTLPGIAGIVLTMGMSVDANVLIFERIKEEMRGGMLFKDAIVKGYDKAFSSIFDSNLTTFLVASILFMFGSGPIKGFAITLMIGIACSFFTAVFITRLIIDWMANRGTVEKLNLNTIFSKQLFANANFPIVYKRKLAYMFSAGLITLGIIALVIKGGFNLGVDFKGGRSYVVQFNTPMVASDVRSALTDEFNGNAPEVKTFGADDRLKVTTSYLTDDESSEADTKVQGLLMKGLEKYGKADPQVLSTSKVGATMADDIQQTAFQSVLLSLVVIFLYILMRFRKWQFGLGAVVALFHDVLVVLSMIAIARLFDINFEIDQVMIAAILTIMGFSLTDTVVIFDRIREYLDRYRGQNVEEVINRSINSTFNRTIITSTTVFIVTLSLFIFGGEVMRGFSFALMMGVLFGTYSSIFIATPVVVDLLNKKDFETGPPVPVTPAPKVKATA